MFAIGRNTRPEDIMYWNVTGQHPHPEIDSTEPNCMNKIVQWMRDDTVPTLQKIGLVALGMLATLAIGFIIGKTLLTCAVVIAITLLWAKIEAAEINGKETRAAEEARAAARALEEQRAAMARMKEAFGGEAAFEALPNLDLHGLMGGTGYIDFVRADDLAAPIMKGTDKYGRPFIAMKVHPNDNAAAEEVFIAFQRYTVDGQWVYKGSLNHFENLAERELTEIRQILGGQHPQYALAAAP